MIDLKSTASILNGTPADVYNRLTHPGDLKGLIEKALSEAQKTNKEVPGEVTEHLNNITFGEDFISMTAGPAGSFTFRLNDCTENQVVKYVGENTPIAMSVEFDIQPEGIDKSLMSISIQADVPFMLRPMIQGPLSKGLDTFSSMMQQIPSWR